VTAPAWYGQIEPPHAVQPPVAPSPATVPPRIVCRLVCNAGRVYQSKRLALGAAEQLAQEADEAMSDPRAVPVFRFDAVGYEAPVRVRTTAIVSVEVTDIEATPGRREGGRR
jgi:hypothetical protein